MKFAEPGTGSHAPAGPVRFGPFTLDTAEARLSRAGQALALGRRAFDVLAMLVANPGRLLTKAEVLDAVWAGQDVTESVLKLAISQVRQALGDDAAAPRFIQTVSGRGYRFMADVVLTPAQPPARAAFVAAEAGNLPVPASPLLGRELELAALSSQLRPGCLVTLIGAGGVGKTRLALEAAAAHAPAEGVWLLRLDELAAPDLIVPALAQALHLGPAAAADAAALGRSLAGSSVRLVLDNAEHLIEGVAAVVASVRAAAPGLQILVTSQTPLRVQDEQLVRLAPLGLPADPADAAPSPRTYAAAQLFCARVSAQLPQWQVNPDEYEPVAAICRALDGIPLALELAAARVPLLGVQGVRQRLDGRFALLTKAARDTAARHRSLAEALDWTYGLLGAAEQAALMRLSVFAGTFSPEAAEQVLAGLGPTPPLDLLDSLVERSLLVPSPGQAGRMRLRMYDSVRGFAGLRLAACGQEHDARARHLQWMTQHAERTLVADSHAPICPWKAALRPELENLRAALHFGLRTAASDDEALRDAAQRLFAATAGFWIRSGLRHEVQAWLNTATALPARPETTEVLDCAHARLVCIMQFGNPHEAEAAARRALPKLLHRGMHELAYDSLHALVFLTQRVRPGEDLAPWRDQMLALERPGWGLNMRYRRRACDALLAREAGQVEHALALYRELAADFRRHGAVDLAWPWDMGAAQMLMLLGRRDEAHAQLTSSVNEIRQAGLLREHQGPVAMHAALALWCNAPGGREVGREAVRVLQTEGMLWWMADALPWAAWHDGRAADAARLAAWAESLVQRRKEQRGPVFRQMRAELMQRIDPDMRVAHAAELGELGAIDLALGTGVLRGMAASA